MPRSFGYDLWESWGRGGSATSLHVVLVTPEIPQNTGSIARTCVVTGCHLHLVEPLGFSLDASRVRRAGLDYWPSVQLSVHPDWTDCLRALGRRPLRLFTAHTPRPHTALFYGAEDALVFGRESTGLPPEILEAWPDAWVRIPMLPGWRSLNLSNAVSIAVYEALRQIGFPGFV